MSSGACPSFLYLSYWCNEPRTADALPANVASSNPTTVGKKGEAGPTNVLVVRGLDENADEEMLRYEFSKHAPIKDLCLVRDKFTHVSRGFAFLHFHTYDAVGWAPKEYNPDNKQPTGEQVPSGGEVAGPKDAPSLQSGFVWDEASGYYYDASSGFYYDGNTEMIQNLMFKERVRWGDPMAHLVKKKYPEPVLSYLGDNDKMKESEFIVPQDIPVTAG